LSERERERERERKVQLEKELQQKISLEVVSETDNMLGNSE